MLPTTVENQFDRGRTTLLLDDWGGQPLGRLLGAPLEIGAFLRLAVSITSALGKVHQHRLVHRHIKPAHILVMDRGTEIRLTGFGLASLLSREHQAPEPPDHGPDGSAAVRPPAPHWLSGAMA
jgi:serine/threonine protein kinase